MTSQLSVVAAGAVEGECWRRNCLLKRFVVDVVESKVVFVVVSVLADSIRWLAVVRCSVVPEDWMKAAAELADVPVGRCSRKQQCC